MNEGKIYYQMQRLGIYDPLKFYMEGLYDCLQEAPTRQKPSHNLLQLHYPQSIKRFTSKEIKNTPSRRKKPRTIEEATTVRK
ncbi:hypothetical protein [Oceanobacillus saliphilus]|uniref:hypothetical protein n=1 Tax=Oceanobacillus saliphilus TaxID=2925834 RepID=UPI00201D681E|nr:hypothetical protein [Oceanobacillus saliphilus]